MQQRMWDAAIYEVIQTFKKPFHLCIHLITIHLYQADSLSIHHLIYFILDFFQFTRKLQLFLL